MENRIKELRVREGLSQGDLAEAMGTTNQQVSRLETGKGRLTVEWMHKIAAALRVAPAELMKSTAAPDPDPHFTPPAAPSLPSRESMPLDIPVLGTAAGSGDGAIQMGSDPIDMVRRPLGISGAVDVYGVYVEGDSMEPRYDEGDLVYVNPNRTPRVGDDVVVQVIRGDGQDVEVVAYVKRLEAKRGKDWVFKQYNPPKSNLRWDGRIKAVHRIYKMNELYGV